MMTPRSRAAAVAAAVLVAIGELSGSGPFMLGGGDAHAIIGRPLTPMSYAGVARRTTRRAYRWGAYGGGYGYGAGAYAAGAYAAGAYAGTVAALPGGCIPSVTPVVYQCGGVRYAPYYAGSTLVYGVVP